MEYKYDIAGPSLRKGRLVMIVKTKNDNYIPLQKLLIHIPAITLFSKKMDSFNEIEIVSRVSMKTGYALVYSPETQFFNFGIFLFGFGISIVVQNSY